MKQWFIISILLSSVFTCQNDTKRRAAWSKFKEYGNFVDSLQTVDLYYITLKENLVAYTHDKKRKQAQFAIEYLGDEERYTNEIKRQDSLYHEVIRKAALEKELRYK